MGCSLEIMVQLLHHPEDLEGEISSPFFFFSSIELVHFSLFQPVPICHSREGGNPRYYLHTLDSRLRGNDTKHVSPIQLEIGN